MYVISLTLYLYCTVLVRITQTKQELLHRNVLDAREYHTLPEPAQRFAGFVLLIRPCAAPSATLSTCEVPKGSSLPTKKQHTPRDRYKEFWSSFASPRVLFFTFLRDARNDHHPWVDRS